MNTKEIGKRIAALRKEKNLSQKELAEKLNISNKTVSKWETGSGLPDLEMLIALSKIFNLSLEEFIGLDDRQHDMNIEKDSQNDIEYKESPPSSPERHRKIKKTHLPFFFVFPALLIVLCYLIYWLPASPQIKDSSIFIVDEDAATLSCVVSNDVSSFSFENVFSLSRNSYFLIYSENDMSNEIPTKKVFLHAGNNIFYVVVKNSSNQEKIYTATIRQAPMYAVTLYSDSEIWFDTMLVEEGSVLNEMEITPPKKQGYSFVRWDYDFSLPINRATKILAIWEPLSYSVNYDLNQGVWGTASHNSAYTSDDCGTPLPSPSRKGYLFEGWKTKQGEYLDSFPTIAKATDLKLVACWIKGSPELKISSDTIVDCDENITSLDIPEKYRGIRVTKVGKFAFSNCLQLKTIEIPSQITQIDSFAFEGCSNISTVTIPKTVTTIGEGAFSGCNKLTKITLPFVGTSSTSRFSGKSSLFGYIFGTKYFPNASLTKQQYSSSTESSYESFYIPNSLKSVTITGGKLLFGAFCGCSSLTNITLPDALQQIPPYSFYDCTNLIQVNIPQNCSSIGNYAFFNCKKMASPILPKNIVEIEYYAFKNCQFSEINLPASLNYIGAFAFSGCNKITEITVPNNVETIEIGTFSGCSALTSITLPFVGNKKSDFISTKKSLLGYIFGNEPFDGSIAISQNYGTYSNNTVTYYIPRALKSVKITGGEILAGAFYNCTTLTHIEITNSVKEIENSAFYNCKNLISLQLPKDIKILGDDTFWGCNQSAIIYK